MRLSSEDLDDIDAQFASLRQADGDTFKDGPVDPPRYETASTRILWILKEAVSDYEAREYNSKLIDDNIYGETFCLTLKRIAYASYGVLNSPCSWQNIPDLYKGPGESLKQVAIINVKKTAGEARSYDKDILAGFDRFKTLILKQIDTYKPDIIYFGMPESCERIVAEICTHCTEKPNLPWKNDESQHSLAYTVERNRLYIWWYHPAYLGFSDETFFTRIVERTHSFKVNVRPGVALHQLSLHHFSKNPAVLQPSGLP